jgi:membrane-anchored protein YejM (alkaline phosphatase superfamily)
MKVLVISYCDEDGSSVAALLALADESKADELFQKWLELQAEAQNADVEDEDDKVTTDELEESYSYEIETVITI